MPKATIYHNPRCSKSRQTLALLEERGVEPQVVKYLETPPDADTLRDVIEKLGISAHDLLRSKEAPYTELELASKKDDAEALIAAMVANPVLIERPIVVAGGKARIGRPPESVLEIL
jgi:arsenate reductase